MHGKNISVNIVLFTYSIKYDIAIMQLNWMGREIHHHTSYQPNLAIIAWNCSLSTLEKPMPKLSIVAISNSNSIEVGVSEGWWTLTSYYESWLMRANIQIE